MLTGASLDEHNKEPKTNLKLASTLLTQARGAVLRERCIKFNQATIETVFEPGEIVRFFKHTVHRDGEAGEIASKFKLKNQKHEVIARSGTMHELRDVETGTQRTAQVSQIARMRLMEGQVSRSEEPSNPAPQMADAQWEKAKQGTFVLFNIRGDPKSRNRM